MRSIDVSDSIMQMWCRGETGGLERILAADVVFHSPTSEYRGSGDCGHMLRLIPAVLTSFAVVRSEALSDGDQLSLFTAMHEDDPMQGVLREERAANARVCKVTLYLRPFDALAEAITHIRRIKQTHPLPSGRTTPRGVCEAGS